MSKNGTDGATVCLHQLALEAWIARTERPANLAKDPLFATYLRGQESPQTYRYLRKWVGDFWDEARLVSFEEITTSLSEECVIASLKGKSLAGLTEIAMRAQNAKRDLSKAFDSYREVLSNGKEAPQQKAGGKISRTKRPVVRQARQGKSPVGEGGKSPVLDGEGA